MSNRAQIADIGFAEGKTAARRDEAPIPELPVAKPPARNFSAGVLMMFVVGAVLLASMALLPPYLQNLANYPVSTAGLVMAPRGVGTMVAMSWLDA